VNLSIDLTGDLNDVSIIGYISAFVGFVVHESTLNLYVFLTNTSFKIREHQLKQDNTIRWDPQHFPITLQTKTGYSHSIPGQQVQNKNFKI